MPPLRRGSCACSIARHRRCSAPIDHCSPPVGSTTRCRAGRQSMRSAASRIRRTTTAIVALFDHEEVGSESGHRCRRTTARARARAAVAVRQGHTRRLLEPAGQQHLRLGRQCPRGASQLSRAARSGSPTDRQPRPGHQTQQQPAVRDHCPFYGDAAAGCSPKPVCPRRSSSAATTCRAAPPSGPITATRLGIETVDVGVPQLSMHSARELCGVEDPVSLAVGLRRYFS